MANQNLSSILAEDKFYIQAKSIVYYVLGVLEAFMLFRFVFKLLAANPLSGFVSLIYTITDVLLFPFTGIFKTASAPMNGAQTVLEPGTLIGMAVYALIAWGVIKLIEVIRINQKEKF